MKIEAVEVNKDRLDFTGLSLFVSNLHNFQNLPKISHKVFLCHSSRVESIEGNPPNVSIRKMPLITRISDEPPKLCYRRS